MLGHNVMVVPNPGHVVPDDTTPDNQGDSHPDNLPSTATFRHANADYIPWLDSTHVTVCVIFNISRRCYTCQLALCTYPSQSYTKRESYAIRVP